MASWGSGVIQRRKSPPQGTPKLVSGAAERDDLRSGCATGGSLVGEVSYKGFRFPAEVISHAVWLYHRFPLSYREVEELLLARGGSSCPRGDSAVVRPVRDRVRGRSAPPPAAAGDKWHLDEVFIKVNGKRQYLWRAVDQDGTVLDILVQSKRDAKAAKRFMAKLMKKQCRVPRVLVTDKCRSYGPAHRELMPSVEHRPPRD